MDVHDVPSASKPATELNLSIPEESSKNPEFYRYLRLRLPLEAGMVLVSPPPPLSPPSSNGTLILDCVILANLDG